MVLGGPDMTPALLSLPDAGALEGLTQYLWNEWPQALMRLSRMFPAKGQFPWCHWEPLNRYLGEDPFFWTAGEDHCAFN